MLKNIKANRIWQILYPLFVYYIFYNLLYGLFSYVFEESLGHVFCLMLSGLITLIPEIIIYRKSPHIVVDWKISDKKELVRTVVGILLVTAFAIALNVLLSKASIIHSSLAYDKASTALSDGSLPIKIMSNAIVIPILEEVLYRGIIAGQLYIWHGKMAAIIISSFCFGILHFNIVQFLYAFLVGLMLGYLFLYSKKLWVPMVAHGLVNFIVILFS